MHIKQILLWVSILSVAGLAVAAQPAQSILASADSSAAARPVMQVPQYGSGVLVMASGGPACPAVAWYGPVASCLQPYTGEFVVTALNGAEVTRVMTNYLGQAKIDLPPGWYIVGVRTESYYPHASPMIVNVIANRYTSVVFRVDLGLQWQSQR